MRRAALLLVLLPALAAAQAETLDAGRYLAKYPGLYTQASFSYDARDEVFDAEGRRAGSVTPAYGPGNRFPQQRLDLDLDWHLPLFEADRIPLLSSRLWNARARLGYAQTQTRGPIGDAADAQGGPRGKSGVTDLELAFGPVLYGSADWRHRSATPLSVLLLGELKLPIGARDANSPNNVGDSVYAYGARLGAHLQPAGFFGGFLLDAGVRYRAFGHDSEPAFGAQAPARPGNEFDLDATFARRLWQGVYAQVSYLRRQGADNRYENVRQSANPPAALPLMDSFPDPGEQRDAGTREQRLQFGLGGFVTQRWWLGVQYAHPLSGRSGEFDLLYRQQLQNCQAFNNCAPTANGSAHVDGLGSARVYASDRFLLTLSWQPASSRGR